MEPYHGRRGKEGGGVCGMSRGSQTPLLMLAMVASMALVLVWEASPFAGSAVLGGPLLDGASRSALDEQAKSYESRTFLRNPPFVNPEEGISVDDEKTKPYDNVKHESAKSHPSSTLESGSADSTESEATPDLADGQGTESEVVHHDTDKIAEEAKLGEDERDESVTSPDISGDIQLSPEKPSRVNPEGENETKADAIERVPPFENLQRFNETLARESEEVSLAEKETAMAEMSGLNATTRAQEESAETAVDKSVDLSESSAEKQAADETILQGGLDERHASKPFGAPVSDKSSLEDTPSKATNLSSSLQAESGSESEADAISQENGSEKTSKKLEKCDYSVGEWVLDETRPLYSGLECNFWLSPGFSCRLNNHPDANLDRYRWQPAGCDLPVFNASAVLETLRNKVLAFVGDSLGRQQLQSLMCMLTRGKNDTSIADVGRMFGFYTPIGERKPNGFAYRFDATNTTIVFKWTVTLARVQPLNTPGPETRNALHIDRPEKFVSDHLHQLDVVVLNSGHHWNGGKMKLNRYDFYYNNKPVPKSSERARVSVAYNTTVHKIINWLHRKTQNTDKIIYYRSLSPRHFRNGDWNTGGTCDTIRFENETQVQEGNRIDPNAESAIIGTTVNLLNITSLSLERGQTHVSKYGGGKGGQDCLHWCLPGIPDTWNEILLAELAEKFKSRASAS